MEENILICENSLDGVFTGIYEAYARKFPFRQTLIQTSETDNLRLFAIYHKIPTDYEKSEKVAGTIRRRFGEEAFLWLCHALASEDSMKASAVYHVIARGLLLKNPATIMEQLADQDVHHVFELSRAVGNEYVHLRGFLRFKELKNGILYAKIGPKNAILPYLADHFSDRLPQEHFLIYDETRSSFVIHEAGKQWFMAKDLDFKESRLLEEAENEKFYEELFCYFCHRIAIKERENKALQRQMLAIRFRKYMTEFPK